MILKNEIESNNMRYAVAFFAALVFLVGCQDLGKIPSAAPTTAGTLSAGYDTVYTFPQDTVYLTITGGTPPYSILNSPQTAAQCSIAGSNLVIVGSSSGVAIARLADAAAPANTLDLPVIVQPVVSFANSIQPIFVSRYGCSGTVGGCHGGTMGLFLDNATVSYQNLVNVPAQSPGFSGFKRVNPRNLANSLLYVRLSSNDPNISMPQGRTAPFDSTYLSNVRTWILQGAHFN